MSSSQKSKTYTVQTVASRLRISYNAARKFCLQTDNFPVMNIGKKVLVHKQGFDAWLKSDDVYMVDEVADILGVSKRTLYNQCAENQNVFRCLRIGTCVRIPSRDLNEWLGDSSEEKENDYVNHQ